MAAAQVWRRHAVLNRLQSLVLLATMAGFLALLRTHPPTRERVRRLMELRQSLQLDASPREQIASLADQLPFAEPVRRLPRRWYISGLWH